MEVTPALLAFSRAFANLKSDNPLSLSGEFRDAGLASWRSKRLATSDCYSTKNSLVPRAGQRQQ